MNTKYIWLLLIACVAGAGYYFYTLANQHRYKIEITNLHQAQTHTIPLRQEGWSTRGINIVENNANDTIKLWDKYFAPGETGRVFTMDGYDLYVDTPWVTTYKPYKATSGNIVLEYFLIP